MKFLKMKIKPKKKKNDIVKRIIKFNKEQKGTWLKIFTSKQMLQRQKIANSSWAGKGR